MPIDYFVYYRILPESEGRLRAAFASLQAAMDAATGIQPQLLHRVEDPLTWMEIYPGVTKPRAFEAELGLQATRCGLQDLLAPGEVRHLERFCRAD